MTIAAALSPNEIGAFRNEVRGFDAKTRCAYLELTLQLRLRGSLPFDTRFLARIAEVSRRFWEDKVWPLIRDLFVIEEGRIFHPEIERAAPHLSAARTVDSDLSEKRRAAVNSRRDRQTSFTNDLQTDLQTPTKYSMKSTIGALEPDQSRSLSLSESSLSDSLEDHASEREGERGASAGAPTNVATSGLTKQGSAPTNGATNGSTNGRVRPPGKTALPDDWEPSEEMCAKLRADRFDPKAVAYRFRAHYLAKGETRADWDATFVKWCGNLHAFDADNPEMRLPQKIEGGKPADAAPSTPHVDYVPFLNANAICREAGLDPLTREMYVAAGRDGVKWCETVIDWASRGRPADRPPPSLGEHLEASARAKARAS